MSAALTKPRRLLARNTDPVFECVDVTPALAAEWLEQNQKNRDVRRAKWLAYSRNMQTGDWRVTAEPIKFDIAGRLVDGQHRLMAVIACGLTIRMAVARELPTDAQDAMDSGIKRTAGDRLRIEGHTYAQEQAAIARLALGVAYAPDVADRYAPSDIEVLQFIDEHPALVESAAFAAKVRNQVRGCPPRFIGYTHLMLSHLDMDQAENFWETVASRAASYDGDPAVALSRKFADLYRDRARVTTNGYLSLIYRTWNNRRAGNRIVQVKVSSPAGKPFTVPVPK